MKCKSFIAQFKSAKTESLLLNTSVNNTVLLDRNVKRTRTVETAAVKKQQKYYFLIK